MAEPTALPEQTALQLAQGQHQAMLGAVGAAVSMLEDQRRRRPLGLTVDDQAVLDGLRMALATLPLLIGYAVEVQTARDALAARVAVDERDTTAAQLLAFAIGLVADCAVPGTPPTTTPSLGVLVNTSDYYRAGWQAGDLARAQRVQARTAEQL